MPTPLEKFQSLLRELFQFEQADLDFGVYRIMNLRRARMEKWLNEELPARASAILKKGGNTADDDLGGRLEVLKAALLELEPGCVDEDGNITKDFLKKSTKGKEYLKLKAQTDRAPARTAAGMEPLVYNHLYDFFSRYYDTGDFIPKRRRSFAPDGRDTYAIPWDGEEVVLHWANKDQYYIKTGGRFTHYRWQSEAGGRTFNVEFRLTDADLPANNNKDAKKKFNLLVADKVEWQEYKTTLILPFHYRGLTPEEEGQLIGTQEAKLRESIIKRTVDTLREMPAIAGVPQLATALMAPKRDAAGQEKRDKDGNAVPLLPHHLNRWAVKNESDFFIHKDLRRFLSGELDYFLKSVVLNLDNLLAAGEQRAEPNFRLLDAVKRLGTEIVDFVSQLENFQKALFEKKKFVLGTEYLCPIQNVPRPLWKEVCSSKPQLVEWEDLYGLSKSGADDGLFAFKGKLTEAFLENNPTLVVNTALYDGDFTRRLLEGFPDLDSSTDGVLVKSENLQALRLLETSLVGQVDFTYIDPPYNTGDDFIYKDRFQRSTWLALIEERLALGRDLMKLVGTMAVSIDDGELGRLVEVCGSLFGEKPLATLAWDRNRKNDARYFSVGHEYMLVVARSREALEKAGIRFREPKEGLGWAKKLIAGLEKKHGKNFDKIREEWLEAFDDVVVSDPKRRLMRYGQVGPRGPFRDDGNINWPGSGGPRYEVFHPVTKKPCRVPSSGWRFPTVERFWEVYGEGRIIFGSDETTVPALLTFLFEDDSQVMPTVFYSYAQTATQEFEHICGKKAFENPKPWRDILRLTRYLAPENRSTVLDFFAGSGTTMHAVIACNRMFGGERRCVSVDMGDHFDSILLKRTKRIMFTPEWKNTIPKRRPTRDEVVRTPRLVKVLRLESYEDALDNIEFNSGAAPGAELGLDFRRDYELRYALDWESKDCPTRLAVDQLDTPFDYTLTLRRESGTVEVKPDLPETFAYLIGLHTRRRFRTERDGVSYLIYTGTLHADGTEAAVLWRTCKDWMEANLKAEMDWWRAQRETLAPSATRVYVNGASAIEGHHSLDAEFKARMHGATV